MSERPVFQTGLGSAEAGALWSARRQGLVLYLTGDIDLVDGAEVADRIIAEMACGLAVLDLTGVRFCDAAGVRAVLEGHAVRPTGTTVRVRCAGLVLQVMEICGLGNIDGLMLIDMGETGEK